MVQKYPTSAYVSDAPTLGDLEKTREGAARLWLKTQMLALFFASEARDKNTVNGIDLFIGCIASDLYGYKLTELMLFFARYKSGRYDNSYATFDSRRIGHAFFREFLPERRQELEKVQRTWEQRKVEARRWTPPKGYTSLSWYEHCKRLASEGDTEILKPPKR
jgi:hypothetical protein